MPVILNHFESLRSNYSTWSELKEHLTSKAGGSIRVVGQDTEQNVVLRYVKGESSFRTPGVGMFRSVVWDTVANLPVCVAPVKAEDGAPPLNKTFTSIQDFLDGVLMQVYVTAAEPTVLRVCSRTKIGAGTGFYSSKTFSEMFTECIAATPVRTLDTLLMHLRETMDTVSASSAFASFVLQHPEHRIVAKIHSPDINMVHMGTVSATGLVTMMEQAAEWPPALRRLQISSYPVKAFGSEDEIQDLMRRTAVQNGFRWQGLVFKDGTGARWRLRSPGYLTIRTLRGSEATEVDRFLRLRNEGQVLEYLKHYGEERKNFWAFESILRERTADILSAYSAVHKAHTLKFSELPAAYKTPVHLLHVEYLNVLRQKKHTVQLNTVIGIVNGLKMFEQRRLLEAAPFVPPEPVAEAVTEPEPVAEPVETV